MAAFLFAGLWRHYGPSTKQDYRVSRTTAPSKIWNPSESAALTAEEPFLEFTRPLSRRHGCPALRNETRGGGGGGGSLTALTQDVGHGLHQVPLPGPLALGRRRPLGQHEAGHDGARLVQEAVQDLHAGGDALGQRPADDRVVPAHVLQDHAHVADGAPLHGQAGQPLVPPPLAQALHGGVGEAVVALARVPAAAAHGRERHEVAELRAQLPGHPAQARDGS